MFYQVSSGMLMLNYYIDMDVEHQTAIRPNGPDILWIRHHFFCLIRFQWL